MKINEVMDSGVGNSSFSIIINRWKMAHNLASYNLYCMLAAHGVLKHNVGISNNLY